MICIWNLSWGRPYDVCLEPVTNLMRSMDDSAFVNKDDLETFFAVLNYELDKIKKEHPECKAVLDTSKSERIVLRESADELNFYILRMDYVYVEKLMAYDQNQQKFVDKMKLVNFAAEVNNEHYCLMSLNVPKMAHDMEYRNWLLKRLHSLKQNKTLPYLCATWQ